MFQQVIPLYFIILLGLISNKIYGVTQNSISKLLIYIIAPLVIFYGAATVELNSQTILLPIIAFSLGSIISTTFYLISKLSTDDSKVRSLIGFSSGTGNTGYFGIPLVLATLGEQYLPLTITTIIGFVLFENTLGYFLTAKGEFSTKKSLQKLAKLPTIYAFLTGITLNLYFQNPITIPFIDNIKGTYSVLGMLIIGISLGQIKKISFNKVLFGHSLVAKFLVWPLTIQSLIYLDHISLQFLNHASQQILTILSIVPIASNTVALATEFKLNTQQASLLTFISTLITLIFISMIL